MKSSTDPAHPRTIAELGWETMDLEMALILTMLILRPYATAAPVPAAPFLISRERWTEMLVTDFHPDGPTPTQETALRSNPTPSSDHDHGPVPVRLGFLALGRRVDQHQRRAPAAT